MAPTNWHLWRRCEVHFSWPQNIYFAVVFSSSEDRTQLRQDLRLSVLGYYILFCLWASGNSSLKFLFHANVAVLKNVSLNLNILLSTIFPRIGFGEVSIFSTPVWTLPGTQDLWHNPPRCCLVSKRSAAGSVQWSNRAVIHAATGAKDLKKKQQLIVNTVESFFFGQLNMR